MRRLLPGSIVARSILALLAGLALSHAISVLIYQTDRHYALLFVSGHQVAEQVAATIRLFEDLAEPDRQRLVAAVDSPTMKVWTTASPVLDGLAETSLSRSIQEKLIGVLGEAYAARIRVASGPAEEDGFRLSHTSEHAAASPIGATSFIDGVRIVVQLNSATWLNFAAPLSPGSSLWSTEFLLSMALMAIVILPLSVWTIRVATKPLATFARAAERLGVDVSATALSEEGPNEVVLASRAFNQMQSRIRRLVEDRTQMLAAISHDLRTPITRLRLRAEFVGEQEQREKMLADLGEMEAMIASALAFARDDMAREERRPVDFRAIVQSICDDMQDAGLRVELAEGPRVQVRCRPLAIKRALTNVLDNAVKYGANAQVAISAAADNIEIVVDDDGPGIPKAEQERVFAPFVRLEQSRNRETGGTGLGLSVARSVVREHGGDIRLENRASRGLRVHIVLPK